jgi:phosphopantetheinyl transferase
MVYLFLTQKTDSTDEIVARLARRYCALVGLKDGDFSVARADRGKPYFPNTPSVHFSVSHTGNIFACGFSDEPIGLDIQVYKSRQDEADRCKKIAARFFHRDEIDALDADTVSAFYNIWTAKEAYVKLTGQGIDGDFSEFCIFDLDEYLFQTEFEGCSLSVCTPDFCEVEIIDLYSIGD